MSRARKDSIVVGVLFITAIFFSIIGGTIVEGIVGTDGYLLDLYNDSALFKVGVALELLNGVAVIGIATFMYRYIRKYDQTLSVGYFGVRFIETITSIVPAVLALSLISLSKNYSANEIVSITLIENIIINIRSNFLGLLVPISFSISALILYYYLFKTKLVPIFIPIWGSVGVILILIMNSMGIVGNVQIILALPIITNELFLGGWLITKGFKLDTAK